MTDPVYNKKAPPAANKTRQCRTSGNSFHEFKSDWSLVRICRIFLKLVSSLKKITNSISWQAPNHPSLWFASNKKSLLPPDSNRDPAMYSTDGEQPARPTCSWPQPHSPKPPYPLHPWARVPTAIPRGAELKGFKHMHDNNGVLYQGVPCLSIKSSFLRADAQLDSSQEGI